MSARLGIVGGGQLALYLCEAARALDIATCVFTDSEEDPALARADTQVVGKLQDGQALERFLDGCDVVTFDKEAIPNETLERLVDAEGKGQVTVYPGADTLLMLKDKALQKAWLQKHDLPTLPFQVLSGRVSGQDLADAGFGGSVVQKARSDGYDGRGVQILPETDVDRQLWDLPSIVEPYLADCREISVITARDRSGHVETYPPVGMEFDHSFNSVKTVSMPADIDPGTATTATELAERVVTLLNGVGVFAVEMFLTPAGEVLINEISPRVHNSGHLTLDACNVSQFEQHVRAVVGLPLVNVKALSPAVMANILYCEAMREHCPDRPVAYRETHPGVSVYWYGKAPGMSGRKMGHINVVADNVQLALERADGALREFLSDGDA